MYCRIIRPCLVILSLILLLSCCTPTSSVFPETYDFSLAPDNLPDKTYMHMRVLDSVGLRLKDADGKTVNELSGLAWDEDEQLLYGVSDEGILHHLRLEITGDQIKAVHLAGSFILKDAKGKPLSGKKRDSEGLALINGNNGRRGDSRLLISFEGKPRIWTYSPQGEFLADNPLPAKLKRKKNYRGGNKMLESVAIHPELGILTAAEYPLKGHSMRDQTIYSINGQEFHFRTTDAKKSAVTGLATMHNGDILVLERAWAGFQYPLVISLREIRLKDCTPDHRCPVKDIAVLSSAQGWYMDNFEGITRYRDNRYFMVSDDNRSSLQSTVLVFFEVKS